MGLQDQEEYSLLCLFVGMWIQLNSRGRLSRELLIRDSLVYFLNLILVIIKYSLRAKLVDVETAFLSL